jgi:hypothetical protein
LTITSETTTTTATDDVVVQNNVIISPSLDDFANSIEDLLLLVPLSECNNAPIIIKDEKKTLEQQENINQVLSTSIHDGETNKQDEVILPTSLVCHDTTCIIEEESSSTTISLEQMMIVSSITMPCFGGERGVPFDYYDYYDNNNNSSSSIIFKGTFIL